MMKSAYELAMERLEKASGPSRKLTDAQKARIAEIDNKYEARAAEAKLGWENKIQAASSLEEFENLKAEMAAELKRLETNRDEEKERVWNES